MAEAAAKPQKNRLRRFPGIGVSTAFFFAYLYLPIVIVIALSFNENRIVTIWTGFTFDWYPQVLGNSDLLRAGRNSLIVAVSASLMATVLAIGAALGLRYFRPRRTEETGTTALMALPLLVPEIVTAVATLIFFVAIGMRLGLTTIIIAHTVFCIPFAYLPIRARLQGLDPALRDAAFDLYADEWQSFRRVTLPLLWPGILSGLLLAFIVSLDNFVITFFVAGPGATTLPVYIYSMIRMGVTPEVNVASALLLMVSLAMVTLSMLLLSRRA